MLCGGQQCLPVGQSDIPRTSTVKIFCPKCEDVYFPRSKYQGNIDGAYFGTTFPHLFLMTYGVNRTQHHTTTHTTHTSLRSARVAHTPQCTTHVLSDVRSVRARGAPGGCTGGVQGT